ncbi:hypothetical protein QIS74_04771 [Colletotrichum tabaci]|uniref:Uncharacterized protein n=1 Tax=Colletotrichum tabaci TaxID=1209068 RepID=A0AAV9TJ63_9PEZI
MAPMEQLRDFRLFEFLRISAMMGHLKGCLPVLMIIFLARTPAPRNEDKGDASVSTPTNKKKRKKGKNEADDADDKSKKPRDQKTRKLAFERDKGR